MISSNRQLGPGDGQDCSGVFNDAQHAANSIGNQFDISQQSNGLNPIQLNQQMLQQWQAMWQMQMFNANQAASHYMPVQSNVQGRFQRQDPVIFTAGPPNIEHITPSSGVNHPVVTSSPINLEHGTQMA